MEIDDIEKIAIYIRDKRFCCIGVDGTNGAGKSTMAIKLAEILELSYLNLDEYLDRNKGGFLNHLKYDELKKKISELECFVIDGICLLNVLEKIETPIDCLIYVKRMCHGLWADEDECELTENIEEYIKKEKQIVRLIERLEILPDSLGLAEEIIRYHNKYKPHHKAQFYYTREGC